MQQAAPATTFKTVEVVQISAQLDFSSQLGCTKCKRCLRCLYGAVVLHAESPTSGSENTAQLTRKIVFAENPFLPITSTHSQASSSTTPDIGTKEKDNLSTAPYGCSCEEKTRPKPLISECYTCTRVLRHHSRLPSILKAIEELFHTPAPATLMATRTHFSKSHLERPEYEYFSLLGRFLADHSDEQYSIFAIEQ